MSSDHVPVNSVRYEVYLCVNGRTARVGWTYDLYWREEKILMVDRVWHLSKLVAQNEALEAMKYLDREIEVEKRGEH